MTADTTLTGRLRRLVGPGMVPRIWGDGLQSAETDPVQLSHRLLTSRGEASGVAIAQAILSLLDTADDAEILRYFHALRDAFEVDIDAIIAAAAAAKNGGPAEWKTLQLAAEPPRQELFRRLNAAPGGTARLVALRAKLLKIVREDPSLAPIDSDLRHLLRSWFNRGFLVPARIDWKTSAEVLEKIIAYEAVHAIDDWDALRQRLAPADRRCFAFFHPSMPDDPLIFVEVALTKGLAASVQGILDTPREVVAPDDADTAIFYSISNCQAGLAGISFGAFLIKQVAADLKAELPNLTRYATLSPLPGFAAWLARQDAGDEDLTERPTALAEWAARYLLEAKTEAGLPLDPVARFHLGNGAELHRIHAGADTSPKGMAQSHGVMVNYLYELDQVEARHETYAASGEFAVSRQVRALQPRRRPARPTAT